MTRVERFEIEIQTGTVGTADVPRFCFNGFQLEFRDSKGSTAAGGTFTGGYKLGSVAHEFLLVGPTSGRWHIAGVRLDFTLADGRRYQVALGEVTLDESNALNLWRPPPLPTFDV